MGCHELLRVEDTNDRFVRELAWLSHVVVWKYPKEHWIALKVRKIMEIDPQCIPGDDRSYLRFVIALCHPHIPNCVGVHTRCGPGITLRQDPVAFWPLAEQFDEAGDWIPFFGLPPPPLAFGAGPPHLLGGPPSGPGPPPPLLRPQLPARPPITTTAESAAADVS